MKRDHITMNYNKVPFNIRNVLFISLLIPFLTFGKNSKLNSYELGLMHGVKGKFFAAKKELKKVKNLVIIIGLQSIC